MTSTTLAARAGLQHLTVSPATRLTGLLASVGRSAKAIAGFLRMPAPGVPEATAQLLRMAEAYEATQPSYAADLRAAASMSERQLGRTY